MGCCESAQSCCDASIFNNPHVLYISAMLVMIIVYLSWSLYRCRLCK